MTNWLSPNPFHENPIIIERPDSSYNLALVTDHKWKQFKYGYEVPESVRKSEFDYLEDAEGQDGYFKRKGDWHHLSQFTSLPKESDLGERGWQGILHYSMSNGLVIKVSDDGEEYQVGYYYLTSEGK